MSTRLGHVVQLLIVLAIIVVIAGALSLIIYWERASAAGPQPIPFPHVKMVGAGVPCLFCHSGATKSPAAGIPSVERCLGCHRVIATDSPLIGKLFAYYGKTIPWVRINRLPRFVHFSHESHVNNDVACERCHGDVGKMTETVQVYNLNMGFCLDCHEQQPANLHLTDCSVCHY